MSVHDNEFRVTPANIGRKNECCARQAIIANWGTVPDWSPYRGEVIEEAITLHQNNHFNPNHYVGPRKFMLHDTSQTVAWSAWRAAPYAQDAGSTLELRRSAASGFWRPHRRTGAPGDRAPPWATKGAKPGPQPR